MNSFLPADAYDAYMAEGVLINDDLLNVLDAWASRYADRVALEDDCQALSYRLLQQRVVAFAFWMVGRGIAKDDRVIVQLPNSVNFFIVVLGIIKAGGIPVLVLPGHRAYEVDGICESSSATHYVAQREHDGFSYLEIAERFPWQRDGVVFVDDLDLSSLPMPSVDFSFPVLVPNQVAFLLLSGGTTNIPKLIPRTHADYLYNFTAMAQECEFDESTRYLCTIPVAHNFALGCPGVLGALSVGGYVRLQGQVDIIEFSDLLISEAITATALVPALAELFIQYLIASEQSFPSLKLMQIGAARFSKESAAVLRAFLVGELQHVYGMAEGLICFNRHADALISKIDTQGTPLSMADEIRVVSSDGQQVPAGQVGELHVRGAYTIRGYFNNAEANISAFTDDGFYKSGDLVRRDTVGNVTVVGRAQEQINRAGEKYSPGDIEAIMAGWEKIVGCSVVGVDNFESGEKAVFFIRAKVEPVTRADVCHYLEGRGVACYKYPDDVVLVQNFPLTAVGKINKNQLKADYLARSS